MSFISEAAERLITRSVCTSIVPPEMYTILADWEKREIPLDLVLAAIDEAPRDENAVVELRRLVNRNFSEWLRTQES